MLPGVLMRVVPTGLRMVPASRMSGAAAVLVLAIVMSVGPALRCRSNVSVTSGATRSICGAAEPTVAMSRTTSVFDEALVITTLSKVSWKSNSWR